MSIELKIKSKHLSEEARIIRFEEHKLFKQYQWAKRQHYATGSNDEYKYYEDPAYKTWESLNRHRRIDVRNENRATFLARAYLANKPYASVEAKRNSDYTFIYTIMPRIVAMVAKYGANKIPLKIYDSTLRNYVKNPELASIEKAVWAWVNTN